MNVKNFGLSKEERETLAILMLEEEQWSVIVKLFDGIIHETERSFLNVSLSQGAEKLAYAKARVEGAHTLKGNFFAAARDIANKENKQS